jgi:glycine cleavage system transcriptional repressor
MHNRRMNAEVDDQYLVLSALGPDRPGLVSQVTRHLTEHGGNIEDSRMAVLGGEFGILVLVRATGSEIRRIESELSRLETETGLKIITRPTKSPEAHRRATSIPVAITADAIDHEGIVNAVSTALHLLEVNIVSLETSSYNAPVTGSPLFRLVAKVDVPRDVTVPNLRKRLDEVAERLNIDIDVRA